ncbi:hypothetical protein BN12_40058 [Nostocoides japonicum T1-X7]|uniref:CBM-cenC domain-containing protein n=1 Tax=Nostocoides japonicum T1-X7 TaxID=1194083 RepID=A0A077LYV2_9MICO|nr:carbohydrate binding domain-containing protein [Tetrasphaera japonica]CCH79088.1 hypothetical protein BN12_40058 [Tetrasphaera japonica T1-X7]
MTDLSATVQPAAAARYNLPFNPSFETDLTGWAATAATVTRQTSDAFGGSASARLVANGTGRARLASDPVYGITVQPGTTYTLSAYFKVTTALSQPYSLGVEMYDNFTAWTFLADAWAASTVQAVTSGWVRRSVTFTTPPDCTKVIVYAPIAAASSANSTDTVWVDAVLLEEGATAQEYFDTYVPPCGPSVRLNVTGAPNVPASAYTSLFSTTDGWSTDTSNTTCTTVKARLNFAATTNIAWQASGDFRAIKRTVSGLASGSVYRYRAVLGTYYDARVRLAVYNGATLVASTSYVKASVDGDQVSLSVDFTAPAASVTIKMEMIQYVYTLNQRAYALVSAATVDYVGGWQGTTIYRTDANGSSVVVREDLGGQDTPAGVMQVTDWEAALYGDVQYVVVDGSGGTASATVPAGTFDPTTTRPVIELPLRATPSGNLVAPAPAVRPALITDYSENAQTNGTKHQVIGRPDPLVNPGPLSTRNGTFTCLLEDYAAARGFREFLGDGDLAMLRQAGFPGLDMYFTVDSVQINPEADSEHGRYFGAVVTYSEVARP